MSAQETLAYPLNPENAMNKVPLSILMPVLNEAHQIDRALNSVSWADEIYVVDSHSTDDTQSIAEQHGAQVIQFDYTPPWPKKRNWALSALPFRNEWVLILDADEVMPPEAEKEIREAIRTTKYLITTPKFTSRVI